MRLKGKIWTALLALTILLCCAGSGSTGILADKVHKNGLEAIWYQAEEYITNPAGLGQLLSSSGTFDQAFSTLFEGTDPVFKKVSNNILDTFEIAGWNADFAEIEDGLVLYEEADDAGLELTEDGGNVFSLVIEYKGFITASKTGEYQFLSKYCDNNLIMEIDGKRVFEFWGGSNYTPPNPTDADYVTGANKVTLQANVPVPFHAYYLKQGGGNVLRMDVKLDNGEIQEFADLGFKLTYETEGTSATQSPEATEGPTQTPVSTTASPEISKTPSQTKTPTVKPTVTGNVSDKDTNNAPGTGVIIGIIAAVLVIGGGVAAFIIIKNKKGK